MTGRTSNVMVRVGRRLQSLLLVVAVLALLTIGARPSSDRWYLAESRTRLTHGALLGAVTDTSVKLWARADGSGRLSVEVKPTGTTWPGQLVGGAELTADRDFSGVVEVLGLAPATRYDYRPVLDGVAVDSGGTFQTLPPDGQPGVFRFALGGDLSAEFGPFDILEHLRAQRPDFALLLGDLIYADHPSVIPATAEAYRSKYRANWSDASFRRLTRHVPSFMIWDDHEIVNDYDAGLSERYLAARVALDDYVASHNPAPRQPGGLYYLFRVADVEFFVLDTRSHRDHRQTSDSTKTLLGNEQKAELKAWLQRSRAPFKVIVSSVPFHDLGHPTGDAWHGFAAERAELLAHIREQNIGGVVILSGDQHWSSLVRHDPNDVWEFNATPLAQHVRTLTHAGDPRLVLAYNESVAFGIIDVDTRGPNPRMTFTVLAGDGQVRASHTIQARAS